MDQDTLVTDRLERGRRIVETVGAAGFEVRLAFWAKVVEDDKWYLYMVSPFVDAHGPLAAYGIVLAALNPIPGLDIGAFDIRVLGVEDSLAEAARLATVQRGRAAAFAPADPKLPARMTHYNGSTLGGVAVEDVLIYPPVEQPAAA